MSRERERERERERVNNQQLRGKKEQMNQWTNEGKNERKERGRRFVECEDKEYPSVERSDLLRQSLMVDFGRGKTGK